MKSDDSMSEQPIPLPSQNILGKQVIVLAGATSVGKSACAAELCKIYDAEIVIADSVQVNKPKTNRSFFLIMAKSIKWWGMVLILF